MGENVPRRMRRHYRGDNASEQGDSIDLGGISVDSTAGPEREKVDKEITMQLAMDEVTRFKEEHNRLPKKDEYDNIAESIYNQTKDKEERAKALERLERKKPRDQRERPERKMDRSERKKERLERKRHGRDAEEETGTDEKKQEMFNEMQQAAKSLGEKEIKGMSVEDLFGEGNKTKGNDDEFSLGQEEKSKSISDEFSLGELSDFDQSQEKQQGEKCPKCGNETEEIVFCPECGTAFCEKCAKKVSVQGNVKTFVCPNCSKEIKK